MKKTYTTPTAKVFNIILRGKLMIGSTEKSVEVDNTGTPIDLDEDEDAALGRQQNGLGSNSLWSNEW